MAARPATTTRTDEALGALEQARAQTVALVADLSDAELERVYTPLMSPLVWDLGHIAAYEDLWLACRGAGLPLLRGDLADTYDAFETPRADRGDAPYLRRAECERYLADVRARVVSVTSERGVGDGLLHELVARHERQHAETMLQTLMLARLARDAPPPAVASTDGAAAPSGLELVRVAGGEFPLGAGEDEFSYDNERPLHVIAGEPFEIGRVAVTNGDWLRFIEDGGYRRRQWWSEAGWSWRSAENAEHPLHWLGDETEWRLGGPAPLDPARPVIHVSWFEADAFARSHGLRLPDEAEWERAATWDGERKLRWPWGDGSPTAELANTIEGGALGTVGAGALPDGASPCGALGMIGNAWEWTASRFGGYPGFRAHPYREYSEVFFGGDYRVLRGGSWASSGRVCVPAFRNWDHPQRRQIFSGLRVAA